MNRHEDKTGAYCLQKVVKKREKGGSVFELFVDSFVIPRGDFVAIVGSSGCGKSTLLDMLGLVLTPSSADEFTISGADKEKKHHIEEAREQELAKIRKSHIGYVLQTGGLLPFLTVRENIELPCIFNNQNNYQDHIDALVDTLDIKNQLDKKPQFLSGGQRQRVAIARALSHKPPIVLADEPTAAVDKYTADTIIKKFKTLTRDMGVTLIMVTHDTNLIEGVANRIFSFKVTRNDDDYTHSKCIECNNKELLISGGKK